MSTEFFRKYIDILTEETDDDLFAPSNRLKDARYLYIPGSNNMTADERHQAILARHPEATLSGKTPGVYKTKSGKLISGAKGVRKLSKLK